MTDIERRKNSNISALNLPVQCLGSASYLINIKKLIEECNIEGEKKDFKSMKTNSMGKQVIHVPAQYYNKVDENDPTLIFESRFESGNLLAAIKVSDIEYDLVL